MEGGWVWDEGTQARVTPVSMTAYLRSPQTHKAPRRY